MILNLMNPRLLMKPKKKDKTTIQWWLIHY